MPKNFFAIIVAVFALIALVTATGEAARIDMLGGEAYVTHDSGRMTRLDEVEPETSRRGGETIYYVRTDGDDGPVAEGLKSGIYFFAGGGRVTGFISCEPFGGSEFCYPILSPDGNTLVLDSETDAVRSFGIYRVSAGNNSFEFTGIATFDSVSTPAWIDSARLIYNSFEANRPSQDAREYKSSVCVYDIRKSAQTMLARHTDVSDYTVEFSYDDGEAKPTISGDSVEIVRTYVDAPNMWNDFDNLKQEKILIELPN